MYFEQPNIEDTLKQNISLTKSFPAAITIEEFKLRLENIKWFANVGKTAQWDLGSERLTDWDDWVGPEYEEVEAFYLHLYEYEEAIDDIEISGYLNNLKDEVENKVYNAATKILGGETDGDCYDLRSMAAVTVSKCAVVIACYIKLNWLIPDDLSEVWLWIEEGHLPCGYQEASREDGFHRRGLMVY